MSDLSRSTGGSAASPRDLLDAWRAATDAYAQWRRCAAQLQALGQGHQGQTFELQAYGGRWSLTVGNGDRPVVTASLLAADDCTP